MDHVMIAGGIKGRQVFDVSLSAHLVIEKGMDMHSVFSQDVKLDRQTFQLDAGSPCLKIPGLEQLDTRFGLEPEPWGASAAAGDALDPAFPPGISRTVLPPEWANDLAAPAAMAREVGQVARPSYRSS